MRITTHSHQQQMVASYVPENILRMDVYENDVYRTTDLVKRNGKLYDKLHHTFKFDPQKSILL